MRHQQAATLLGTYLDGELNLAQRAELEAHLTDCRLCADQLADMRRVSAQLGAWPAPARMPAQSEAFRMKVLRRLPAGPISTPRRPLRGFLLPAGLVACGAFVQAGAVLTLVIGLLSIVGAFCWAEGWLGSLLGNVPSVSAAGILQFTWAGWLGTQALAAFGLQGTVIVSWLESVLNWILPALAFAGLLLLIGLGLSGWAGVRLSRERALELE